MPPPTGATARRILTGLAAAAAVMVPAPAAGAADRPATPATLASVVSAAQGGDVIHLAAGDYGRFRGASKPAMVTLVANPGATATIDADLEGAKYLRFVDLRLTSANLVRSTHIEFANNVFTGSALIDTTDLNGDHAIVFDANSHRNITVCSTCYEGRVTVHGSEINRVPVGVTIKNSFFGDGGNSDGIQVGSYGVEVLGNEFADLYQGDPRLAHTDALQLYGQSHTVIRNNYMHNVATGILCGDGCDHEVIENNVVVTRDYPWPILLGPDRDSIIRHNTLPFGGVRVDEGNGPGTSQRTTITDNVVGGYQLAGAGLLADFNLVAGATRGVNDLRGSPRFIGGRRPNSLAGFALAAGSPGKGDASDGTDRGVAITALATPAGPAQASRRVIVSVRRSITLAALRKGVRVKIRAPERVKLRLSLVPRGGRHSLAARSTTLRGTRTYVLRPRRASIGRRRNRTLALRVRSTDSSGATTTQSFRIRVRA
ncbi:MAG TPA: hypothetical protein VGO80_00950 [Solirubrobacteraceae bacterium]|nr:hypothetical protein [Solirubrobacteraceae bacterium]